MAKAQPKETTGEQTDSFLLEIVTPERLLVSEEVEALRAPGVDGEFGVLPRHTRLMSVLGIGELSYRTRDGEWEDLAVSTGFVEVLPDRVIVLAQTAEMADEIDVARAEAAVERARRRLLEPSADTDIDRARVALEKALARLQAAGRHEPDGEH